MVNYCKQAFLKLLHSFQKWDYLIYFMHRCLATIIPAQIDQGPLSTRLLSQQWKGIILGGSRLKNAEWDEML